MSEKMIYTTRDKEYQMAGWIGTIQLMQEAGAVVLGDELLARNLRSVTMGALALRFCVNLYQKPDQAKGIVDKWFRFDKKMGEGDYRQALVMIGAATFDENGEASLTDTFSDALAILTNEDIRSFVEVETDFMRLSPLIDDEIAFNRRLIPRLYNDLDIDTYRVIQREIDFRVGFNDRLDDSFSH